MSYVDGFIMAVPNARIEDYKEQARVASKVWMEFGATAYVECLPDDVPYGELTSFPRAVQAKEDETVVFAWAVYPSKEKRDEVMARVMKDPRIKAQMQDMAFDGKRMIFGGFRPFVQLG